MHEREDRRSRKLSTLLVASALLVGGCARQRNALQAQSRVNPVSPAAYPTPTRCPLTTASVSDTRRGAIDLDCFTFPETELAFDDKNALDRSTLAYAMAVDDRVDRNRLTSILIKQSDDVCVQELGRLTANEATTNTVLSILGTGFSTAAAIVSGELAKSILAGVSTLAGASRDHINVHVYRNTIAQAISQVITSERKTRLAEIQRHYAAETDEWSIDDAIRDVNAYHAQCSFFKGLELLLKAADNNTDLQSYRAELARRVSLNRLDDGMASLERTIRSLGSTDPGVADLKARLAELAKARATLAQPPTGGQDAPPPAGGD